MNICDDCGTKKPRRQIKVKDLQYGKGTTQFDLCENCYRKAFKKLIENIVKAGNMK